jgi:hypothetical protein
MKHLNFEFNILVNDKKIFEYQHDGHIFVEGRRKSSFELEFNNRGYVRVLVVPSVDGLCPLDGTPATAHSKGYIVDGGKSIRIPGWTLDRNSVAKFEFQDKSHSYAKFASPSGTANTGVLGIMVLAEEVVQQYQPWQLAVPSLTPMNQFYNIGDSIIRSSSASASVSTTATMPNATYNGSLLGTGFGEKHEFATREVGFKRGTKLAEMVIYYDDRKGLTSRGIKIGRHQSVVAELPNAFSNGCTPPPGWHG